MSALPGRVAAVAILLVWLSLPLGPAPLEVATGLALVAGAVWGRWEGHPLVWPVAAIGLALAASAVGRGAAAWVEAAGLTWPLALAVALPLLVPLVGAQGRARAVAVGTAAVAVAVGVAAVQVAQDGGPGRGLFSHHLTLGYALLPPLAWGLAARRWGLAALCLVGVGLSQASGPALAATVVVVAVMWRPLPALGLGLALALAVIAVRVHDPYLHERAVLWTTGAELATGLPLGTGPVGYRDAASLVQARLQPGFHFTMHAHDAALQRAAVAGAGAWVAWAWFGLRLWRHSDGAGKAALAGLVVGGLTQDTLGDLEVVRALCAWALIGSSTTQAAPTGNLGPPTDVG